VGNGIRRSARGCERCAGGFAGARACGRCAAEFSDAARQTRRSDAAERWASADCFAADRENESRRADTGGARNGAAVGRDRDAAAERENARDAVGVSVCLGGCAGRCCRCARAFVRVGFGVCTLRERSTHRRLHHAERCVWAACDCIEGGYSARDLRRRAQQPTIFWFADGADPFCAARL